MYECLGDYYPFTGPVFTHEKDAKIDVKLVIGKMGFSNKIAIGSYVV